MFCVDVCDAITHLTLVILAPHISSVSLLRKWSDTIGLVIQSPSHPRSPRTQWHCNWHPHAGEAISARGIEIDSKLLSQPINRYWFKEAEKSNSSCYLVKRGKERFRVHLSPKPQTWRWRRGKDHVAHHVVWNENSCSLATLTGVLPPWQTLRSMESPYHYGYLMNSEQSQEQDWIWTTPGETFPMSQNKNGQQGVIYRSRAPSNCHLKAHWAMATKQSIIRMSHKDPVPLLRPRKSCYSVPLNAIWSTIPCLLLKE